MKRMDRQEQCDFVEDYLEQNISNSDVGNKFIKQYVCH
jgi:hypothetical protein